MESCCSLTLKPPPPLSTNLVLFNSKKPCTLQVSAISYKKFVHFALTETKHHTHLVPSPLHEKYCSMIDIDGETEVQLLSFQAPMVRLLRRLCIESETMQILDFAVFPKPEVDLPIFCANFFTTASMNIIVLDLNPLHDVITMRDYKDKYYKSLIPLGLKYAEFLPWGGKLTSESIKFFSPVVIWTKFASSQDKQGVLYSAFVDYYKAWLELMDKAVESTDATQILWNREAQHRYLTWRAEKVFTSSSYPDFVLCSLLFLSIPSDNNSY
ncbi:Fe_bilin_red domain-containing protein [Cephalotus follicularis]|uniref:Fe_bilin_red domain-containing protein n=1 Tax=Cephalotus follicularis TaxID=3775 RepID=A0A1Q3DHD7_CEPFO|nr:Fe_bilin_red domain-containing protein [Cephalotus follicularis]